MTCTQVNLSEVDTWKCSDAVSGPIIKPVASSMRRRMSGSEAFSRSSTQALRGHGITSVEYCFVVLLKQPAKKRYSLFAGAHHAANEGVVSAVHRSRQLTEIWNKQNKGVQHVSVLQEVEA